MRHAAFLTLCCLVTPLLAQSNPDDVGPGVDVEVTFQQPSETAGGSNDLFDSPADTDSSDNKPPAFAVSEPQAKQPSPTRSIFPAKGAWEATEKWT